MTKLKTLDQLRAEKERAETQLAQEKHMCRVPLTCSTMKPMWT